MNIILKDIIKNEKEILYDNKISEKDIEKNYNFLQKNEILFLKIKEILKNYENIINYKNFKEIKEFKNIIENIYKNNQIFYQYLTIFILESFNDGLIENNNIEKKKKTIHDNINRINNNIQNLNIFIRRKNKLEEKKIEKMDIFILKTIKILEKENIINKIKLYINPFKTYDILEIKNFKIKPEVYIYQKEFEIFQYDGIDYLICETFNSIRSTNTINIKTEEFKLGKEKTLISNLCGRKMYIDLDLLETILDEYCKEYNIIKEKIEETYIEFLENHKKLIKENDILGLQYSSKKISEYQKAIIFNYIINNRIKFCYAPIVLDFRGRVYKTSPFSITFVKELRLCIYLGEYEKNFFENYKEGKTDEILNNYTYKLKNITTKEKIMEKNIIIKRALLWGIISIAENIKSNLGKKIKIEDLIDNGINIYNNKNINFEYEKKIKIISTFKTIDMLINDNKILKRPISKDATASVYQHLIKLLKAKDENYYKYANLTSIDTWYDTYTYIIDDWKEKEKEKIKSIDFKEIDIYFNRKTLKKTLMTQNYGCGFEKCKEYFFEQFENIEKENKKKIGKLFYNFYAHISNKPIATKMNTDEILNFLINNNFKKIKTTDGSIISLKYYNTKNKNIDTKIEKNRYTLLLKIRSTELDKQKMEKAAKANYIHMQDSAMARDVASRIACFIIHDCFIIGCLEVSLLIDTINICFNCNYHKDWPYLSKKNFYSIFIVI